MISEWRRSFQCFFRKRPLFFLMAAGACLYFFRLGSYDLKEWDEIYYSSRALTAASSGQWLDQSQTAIGGLWTGSHPPLVVWSMALFVKTAGASEWSFRAPAALAGLLSLLLLYFLTRDLSHDKKTAATAVALLLLTPLFTRYARVAQLDIPLVLWIMLGLYFFRRGMTRSRNHFFLAGLALGLGLMSKIAAALICPLIILFFLVWEFLSGSRREAARGFFGLALMTVLGLLIAAPWHVLMTEKWGMAYWQQAWGYHVFQRMAHPLEGHGSALGIFFWPAQIIIRLGPMFPFVIAGMRSRSAPASRADHRLVWLWLLVPLLIFSVTATKFHSYLLIFLPPLLIFAAWGVRRILDGDSQPKSVALTLFFSVASMIWAQTRPLQSSLEHLFSAFRAGTPLVPSDGIWLGAFLVFCLAGGFFSIRLALGPGLARKQRVWLLTGPLILAPALMLALGPLGNGRSNWLTLRSYLRGRQPQSVTFVGEDSRVNLFYLMLLSSDGIRIRNGPGAMAPGKKTPEAKASRPAGRNLIILQKGFEENAVHPVAPRVLFENKMFSVHAAAARRKRGAGRDSSP